MLEAALWGLVTAGSLWVGAALATYTRLSQRMIGLAMAFGAGALAASVVGSFHDDTARPMAIAMLLAVSLSAAALYGLALRKS